VQGPTYGWPGAAIALFVALLVAPQSLAASNATHPTVAIRYAVTASTHIRSIEPSSERHTAPTPEETGDGYEFRKEYQAAIDAYSLVDPATASVWNKIGVAYQMLFDAKDAARSYTEALKIDPDNSQAMNNLATVEDSLNDFSAAEKLCRKALKLEPRSALLFKNLGTTLLLQHEYKRSSDAYARALALDPNIFEDASRFTAHIGVLRTEEGASNYFEARACARARQADCAISHLRKAFNEGSASVKEVSKESDFDGIRGDARFVELLSEQK
jgi:tetratricopeptide (TPR) repeat protein